MTAQKCAIIKNPKPFWLNGTWGKVNAKSKQLF